MPWKTTKLVFCGIPLRRRTLYIITLASAIALVPTLSWLVLAVLGNSILQQRVSFLVGTLIAGVLALNGWRLILKHNPALFREEARLIWPGSVVLLLVAAWIACTVAHSALKHGRMDYLIPLGLSGPVLILLLVKCATLGSYPKRSSSSRHRSRSSQATTPLSGEASLPEEAVADEPLEDDDEGPESPMDDSTS
jgi:hypothetical protein